MPQSDQPQCDSPTIEPAVAPIPPRYWWLKRIGVVVGFLFVVLFALRLWWGWEANQRLQAEIDKIIAAGEPIYPEDFDPKEDIPDDQNAAWLLLKADETFNFAQVQSELLEKVVGKEALIRTHLAEVRALIEGNAEAFRLARRARNLPVADWGTRMRTPVVNVLLPALSGQRRLSRLLSVAASYQHIDGNDGEAVEILRDALEHSERLAQHPTLIGELVALACGRLAIATIEEVLPSLHISLDEGSSVGETGAASRSQIRSLLASLLDERRIREGMRRAMMCERMSHLDIHNQFIRGNTTMSAMFGGGGGPTMSVSDVAWRHAVGPALTLDIVPALRNTTRFVEAAGANSFFDVLDGRYNPATESGFQTLLHPLQGYLFWSFDRPFEVYFRDLVTRRLAATALAIRLYEIDHGHRPETLAELVPEYLTHIPEDPFAENGLTLRYLPHAAHSLIYSIGENGLDEEGKVEIRAGDVVFFLDGWREKDDEDDKVSPTSTQAGEDQKKIDGDEGDADEDNPGEEEP